MDIAFNPPVLAYVLLGAVVVVAVLAAVLKKMETWKKLLTAGIALAACAAVALFLLRTSHLVVDDQGIRTDTYGKHSISWSGVSKAVAVEDLGTSPYAIGTKAGGTNIGVYKAGWFMLASGVKAFVTTEIQDRALVIEAGGTTFVFGPRDFDAFVAEVAKHVNVERAKGGVS